MAYWNDSVTENPKPVSMMVRLMFTPIILRSIPRKTVTGISMTIIIRTIRGTWYGGKKLGYQAKLTVEKDLTEMSDLFLTSFPKNIPQIRYIS